MNLIILILLVLLLCGGFGYVGGGLHQTWGWGPFGGIGGLLLIILIVYLLVGR